MSIVLRTTCLNIHLLKQLPSKYYLMAVEKRWLFDSYYIFHSFFQLNSQQDLGICGKGMESTPSLYAVI